MTQEELKCSDCGAKLGKEEVDARYRYIQTETLYEEYRRGQPALFCYDCILSFVTRMQWDFASLKPRWEWHEDGIVRLELEHEKMNRLEAENKQMRKYLAMLTFSFTLTQSYDADWQENQRKLLNEIAAQGLT